MWTHAPKTWMREFRWRAGLTHAELAARVCVSRQTIWSIERERSIPSVTLALAIARELDATVEDLFGHRDLR